jgi:uncharacterized membrane protein YhdT
VNRPHEPVLVSARREAQWVLLLWLTAAVYTLSVCGWFGYGRSLESLTYVLGFPDWVFWGIVTPWCMCTAISFVVSRYLMTDGDLGEDAAGDARDD